MPRYLVTGGAGFIGSHLVEELLRRGETVRVVDNLSTGRRDNLAAAAAAAGASVPELVDGDLAEASVAAASVAGVEYVLHQAAIPSVPRSVAEPIASNRANIDATLQLLVAARDAGVRRVVFAGSSSVYGDAAELPKHEGLPLKPLSPYALQKQAGEQYLRLFTSLYGLDTVTTRYFNVFGPRQDPSSPYSGVISLFIRAVLDGQSPLIYGDGEVINVATSGRVSLNALLAEVQRLLGTAVAPTFLPARAGDIRDSQADIDKAARLLGYAPSVPFAEGLRRTVEWAAGRPLRG
jgi:nucleoside-diphosphate-sugar epimerase